ncbi:MAG: hypothetical protein NT155_03230 [Candidatus Staskawiczbacteria bacterium]|nr:hypothetical protein [Candidatus Staskawiczbacteria bacterium]
MNAETKVCQNCKKDFVIEPEDFDFYEKIKVPAPTFCFQCRTVRRLSFRNELSLYKRKCSAPGHNEEMISAFSPEKNMVVYDNKYWWSDQWDPMDFGRDYDFSKTFFEQWRDFRNKFPFQSVSNSHNVNSDYCNVADYSKDCYLVSGGFKNEKVLYSNRAEGDKDSADLYVAHDSELCYDNVLCSDSYHVFYSLRCTNCTDSYFLYDCRNCSNCFGCSNLRSKNCYIFNQPYTKEEYSQKIKEFNLSSFSSVQNLKKEFEKIYKKSVHRYANILKSDRSTGDNLENTKNCKSCFDIKEAEEGKYNHWGGLQTKDFYDSGPGTGVGAELLYETFDTGVQCSRNFFTSVVYSSRDVYYSFNCYDCSDLFGCIGLRSKQSCIFNKQYSKEEYKALKDKIIEHMNSMPYVDKKGLVYKFGEFFPAELSPFAYNETVAQDYFPLNRDQAIKEGYNWRDAENKNYKITINAEDLPDDIKDVDDSISNEIIGCAHHGKCNDVCSAAFRIISQEFQFYKKLGIPLPRYCFGCRHAARLRLRNPMKLWDRQCAKCGREIKTSYAPDRPEIVYCESCYNQEVA